MTQFPQRHNNHSLESRSELFLKSHLPADWIIDKPTDYGIDYKVEIVKDRAVNGQNFSIQLKAHQQPGKGNAITVTLERPTINLYLARLEPVLLVCYIAEHNEAYCAWFSDKTVNLTKPNQSFTIRLDAKNKISSLNWEEVSAKVDAIFSRRSLLYSFPEYDFAEMGIDEKTAVGHYINKDYDTAIYQFKQIYKKDQAAVWLNYIAMCHYQLYQYKDALSVINHALGMADLTEIRLNKASILAEYGIETDNKAMLIQASEIFKTQLDQKEDSMRHYNYANTLGALNEHELAKENYKKALKINPNLATAWKNLGSVYAVQKNVAKELECFDRALNINPTLPQALLCKGITLIRNLEQYEQGMAYLERAFQAESGLFQKYTGGFFWFALASFKIGKTRNGIEFLEKGLEQYPGDPYLLNLKRDYYKDNWHKTPELVPMAKQFMLYRLELEPGDVYALECLMRIYLAENNKISAFALLKKHTVLFRDTDIDNCTNSMFDITPYLDALKNYHHYCQFRYQHPLEKFVNKKNSQLFYFELNEMVGLKLFNESMEFIYKNRKDKKFEQKFIQHQLKVSKIYYPETAPYAISASVEDTDPFGEQMCYAIVHIPILAMRELGRINGYLTVKMSLYSRKTGVAINNAEEQEISRAIRMACLEKIQQRYHFFPNP